MEIKSAGVQGILPKGLLPLVVGGTFIGVPALAAYVGHLQAQAKSKLSKDKDFAAREKKLAMIQEAIDSIQAV